MTLRQGDERAGRGETTGIPEVSQRHKMGHLRMGRNTVGLWRQISPPLLPFCGTVGENRADNQLSGFSPFVRNVYSPSIKSSQSGNFSPSRIFINLFRIEKSLIDIDF